jgi:hypothetical protein
MARKRLSADAKFRKATVRAHRTDQKKIALEKSAKQKHDTLEKWRALRRIGVYETKAAPKLSRINKKRTKEIEQKFKKLQKIGSFERGEVYRPLLKRDYSRPVVKRNAHGKVKTEFRKYTRYELDTTHFQNVKGKPKKLPAGALATESGFIAPKGANEKIRLTKKGKIEIVEEKGGARTRFTREPLSGPNEFLKFADDVRKGRIEFKDNEGIAVWSNGLRRRYMGQSAVDYFVKKMSRYRRGDIKTGHGQKGNFNAWASNSEIALISE